MEEVDPTGAVLAHYAQGAGIDEPLAAFRGGAAGFYEQDGLASVTSVSGSTEAVLNSYTYDSFGNAMASNGSFVNPYLFTGRDYDSETGLRYYRARYYSPDNGRFMTEDPVAFNGGLNFYSYAANDPLKYTDPFGNCVIYLFFEAPGADKSGFSQHAFLITWDNSHSTLTRPREFRAGPDEGLGSNMDSEFPAVMGGGAFAPTDDPKDARYGLTLLNDNCSCTRYWQAIDNLNAFINSNRIPYRELTLNSNSVISTAIDAMGLKRPELPFSPWRVPGWGNPLPGWPPQGAKH